MTMEKQRSSTIRDLRDGTEYEIRFRAKWVGGNSQLNSRLYFNRLANTLRMDVPEHLGTPGQRNSNYVTNTGPVLRRLRPFTCSASPRIKKSPSPCARKTPMEYSR